MGDVAVENPASALSSHTKAAPLDTIPNIDSLEGTGADDGDEYATLKKLQRHLEYVWVGFWSPVLELTSQITGTSNSKRNTSRMSKGLFSFREAAERCLLTWINRSLKRELVRAQEEIKRIQSVPLVIGQFMEAIDQKCDSRKTVIILN